MPTPQNHTNIPLGKLARVDLRQAWADEAANFTPWLAENLHVLGETIGITLELEATERTVGPFRADILAKDIQTNQWVIIENQLGRTDHGHLGQLLTYAAALKASTVIWVAASFTDEHRAVVDWLNQLPEVSFFGLEIELWKVGDSPAAPRFNVICKPNTLAKQITEVSKYGLESNIRSFLDQSPKASIREISRACGCSVSTANKWAQRIRERPDQASA